MAVLDKTVAEARLQLYLDAEARVLKGQAFEVDGYKLTRADLKAIRDGIAYWRGEVNRLTRGGPRISHGYIR